MQRLDSLKNNPQIQRLRQTLIIILCVFYIFSTASSILSPTEDAQHTALSPIVKILLYSIFYGINIFVVYRYSSLGLRIFAWIHVVFFIIIVGGLLILAIFALGAAATVVSDKNIDHPKMKDTSDSLAFTVVVALGTIVQVIIIVFHFKLARFIDAIQNVPIQSV